MTPLAGKIMLALMCAMIVLFTVWTYTTGFGWTLTYSGRAVLALGTFCTLTVCLLTGYLLGKHWALAANRRDDALHGTGE